MMMKKKREEEEEQGGKERWCCDDDYDDDDDVGDDDNNGDHDMTQTVHTLFLIDSLSDVCRVYADILYMDWHKNRDRRCRVIANRWYPWKTALRIKLLCANYITIDLKKKNKKKQRVYFLHRGDLCCSMKWTPSPRPCPQRNLPHSERAKPGHSFFLGLHEQPLSL